MDFINQESVQNTQIHISNEYTTHKTKENQSMTATRLWILVYRVPPTMKVMPVRINNYLKVNKNEKITKY